MAAKERKKNFILNTKRGVFHGESGGPGRAPEILGSENLGRGRLTESVAFHT